MPDPNAASAPAPVGKFPAAGPKGRGNWFGFPSLRLTTIMPLALSLVVFVVTLTISWLTADLVNRQNTEFVADKAQVFLDATAGHFANSPSLSESAFTDALTSALSFKTVLQEEALAVAWRNADGINVLAIPETATESLRGDLLAALEVGRGSPFVLRDNARGVLTNVYGDGPSLFAISGIFDTSALAAANEAVHQAALGLSLLVALAIAGAAYLLARAAISPLVALANRLAEGGTSNADVLSGQYLSSEILEIETILALRREDEKSRDSIARRLAQQERDQVLARLAATLAHEVRNPLAGIRNAFSTLRRFGHDQSVRDETLDIIEGGLDALQRLTDVTLSTYRRRPGDGIITGSDIADLALIISPQVKQRDLQLRWDIPDNTLIVADADAVRQMLVNLLLNACKASPPGGLVEVSARTEEAGVRIAISDQGSGMPEGVRQHLEAGLAGTLAGSRDLGLWVVHSLADELGATVSVQSTVGRGTVVSVLFLSHSGNEERPENG
ncbi:sensor histidine kinase [Devosia chinhatensis]|uniref:histidine kinase n=1 Tax=Devosia chinhatensis TaxID=429727 RepID=A0A0F5FH75_9HYPH|nr:HAMP domain-containing sensor histidine kinase [Devosia chinhatensis]KKB08138.1 hypothetical protein VE26_16395 [Devosia chinhatensis]